MTALKKKDKMGSFFEIYLGNKNTQLAKSFFFLKITISISQYKENKFDHFIVNTCEYVFKKI